MAGGKPWEFVSACPRARIRGRSVDSALGEPPRSMPTREVIGDLGAVKVTSKTRGTNRRSCLESTNRCFGLVAPKAFVGRRLVVEPAPVAEIRFPGSAALPRPSIEPSAPWIRLRKSRLVPELCFPKLTSLLSSLGVPAPLGRRARHVTGRYHTSLSNYASMRVPCADTIRQPPGCST